MNMPFLFGILRETRRRFRMNCNHCKKELNFPKTVLDQLKACPFCGKPLRSINENFKSLGAFIESLVSEYGEDRGEGAFPPGRPRRETVLSYTDV